MGEDEETCRRRKKKEDAKVGCGTVTRRKCGNQGVPSDRVMPVPGLTWAKGMPAKGNGQMLVKYNRGPPCDKVQGIGNNQLGDQK